MHIYNIYTHKYAQLLYKNLVKCIITKSYEHYHIRGLLRILGYPYLIENKEIFNELNLNILPYYIFLNKTLNLLKNTSMKLVLTYFNMFLSSYDSKLLNLTVWENILATMKEIGRNYLKFVSFSGTVCKETRESDWYIPLVNNFNDILVVILDKINSNSQTLEDHNLGEEINNINMLFYSILPNYLKKTHISFTVRM